MVNNGSKLRVVQTNTSGLGSSIISQYGNESLIVDVSGPGLYLGNNSTNPINLFPSKNSDANVQAVDTGDVIDDVNVDYATTAYVDGLVGDINSTIGDINSILESIINGGPSIKLISITVNDYNNGTNYVCQAEEGMTWVDWINSKYNTYGWYIDTSTSYIFLSGGRYILAFQGSPFGGSTLTAYVMEDGATGFHIYDLYPNN